MSKKQLTAMLVVVFALLIGILPAAAQDSELTCLSGDQWKSMVEGFRPARPSYDQLYWTGYRTFEGDGTHRQQAMHFHLDEHRSGAIFYTVDDAGNFCLDEVGVYAYLDTFRRAFEQLTDEQVVALEEANRYIYRQFEVSNVASFPYCLESAVWEIIPVIVVLDEGGCISSREIDDLYRGLQLDLPALRADIGTSDAVVLDESEVVVFYCERGEVGYTVNLMTETMTYSLVCLSSGEIGSMDVLDSSDIFVFSDGRMMVGDRVSEFTRFDTPSIHYAETLSDNKLIWGNTEIYRFDPEIASAS